MTSRLSVIHTALLVLLLFLAALAPACSGSGGGGGGGDDDDDVLPTPLRPGFVVMRLDTMLSIAVADGSDLVDVTDAPDGPKTFVGFSDDDRVLYLSKTAALSTAGDLYIVDVDGQNNTLLAEDVYTIEAWTDSDRLLVTRGPGPDLSANPQRDLYVVSVDGVETPIATTAEDESFAGQSGQTLVCLRGNPATDADFFAISTQGGSETPLTTDGGKKAFAGFTSTSRVVYKSGNPADVFSVALTGGAPATLADRAESEDVAAIRGTRVVIVHVAGTPEAPSHDIYGIDEDGSDEAAIAATPDVPESVAGLTESGRVLILTTTNIDPLTIELATVGLDGAGEVALGDFSDGAVLEIDGETILYSDGGDLFAIEADGTGERTLADEAAAETFIELVNGHVLFRAGAPEKVWTVDLDGGTPEALRSGDDAGETFNVALGPMVVMTVLGAGNKTDLIAANTAGGGLRTLAEDDDTETYRFITPDGRVVYTLNQGPFLDDVFIVNADGTNAINLTDRQDEDVFLGFLP